MWILFIFFFYFGVARSLIFSMRAFVLFGVWTGVLGLFRVLRIMHKRLQQELSVVLILQSQILCNQVEVFD